MLEKGSVRFEEDCCSVFVVLCCFGHIALQDALAEHGATCLSVAETLHFEACAEGIDCFETDAIEADALLEGFGVVLTTCIKHGNCLNKFAKRDASSVVTNTDAEVVFYVDFDAFACPHFEFVDTIVDDFLEKNVDSVFRLRAIAEATDVHTRTCSDMFHVGEVAYVVFAVLWRVHCCM